MARDSSKVLFRAVGDVRVDRPDPNSLMHMVAPVLKDSDLVFGQLESSLSTRGAIAVNLTPGFRADPRMVEGLVNAGFTIMSIASNHTADYGYDAFLDTIENLEKNGIAAIGSGRNIAEARTPRVIDLKGNKLAFIAYNAILQPGYAARENRPGMPPLQVKTFYEQLDWQAGTPAKIWTIADPDHVAAIIEDVKVAKQKGDLAIVSIHWGVHYMVGHLAMYQTDVAHKVIDAGADMILGHHAHNLAPIEFYKGKPIFYGLGNFAFDYRTPTEYADDPYIIAQKELYKFNTNPNYDATQYPEVSHSEVIVNFTIHNKKVERISFLPCYITTDGQPYVVKPDSEEGKKVIDLQTRLCEGYNTKLTVDGDEVVLTAIK